MKYFICFTGTLVCPVLKQLLLTRAAEGWEPCIAGQFVNGLRSGFLDHLGVRKRIMPHNILQPSIEVTDVTASKISESVKVGHMAGFVVRTL